MNNLSIFSFNKKKLGIKIIKIFLIFFVILAGFFLVAGKNKIVGRKFLYQVADSQYHFGDLYNFCEIDYFKEKITKFPSQEKTSFDGVKYLLMGDSFFKTNVGSLPVAQQIEDLSGQRVFFVSNAEELTPLEYLSKNGYQKGEAKILIWETVERLSVKRALALKGDFLSKKTKTVDSNSNIWNNFKFKFVKLKNIIFDRTNVEYFIKNNVVFKPINLWFKNKAFTWFGDIDKKTPLYSINPKMLFFEEDLSFNANQEKFDSLEEITDNIAKEIDLVKEKYNLTVIYVVIPNKFSLYYDFIPNGVKYDNYIPKLQKILKSKGVRYIDIYDKFLKYKKDYPGELLYYPADTHYNPIGKRMLVDEIIKLTN